MKTAQKSPAKAVAKPVAPKKTVKYDPNFTIKVLRTDCPPKRNGRNPYALYRTGATIRELLNAGVKLADFWWDSHGRPDAKVIQIVRK